jgi:hypothetical protein
MIASSLNVDYDNFERVSVNYDCVSVMSGKQLGSPASREIYNKIEIKLLNHLKH